VLDNLRKKKALDAHTGVLTYEGLSMLHALFGNRVQGKEYIWSYLYISLDFKKAEARCLNFNVRF